MQVWVDHDNGVFKTRLKYEKQFPDYLWAEIYVCFSSRINKKVKRKFNYRLETFFTHPQIQNRSSEFELRASHQLCMNSQGDTQGLTLSNRLRLQP